MRLRTEIIPELTISRFDRLRDVVDLNPPYQREGEIWRADTRSTLIDSIINSLDLPKLYFEKLSDKRLTPSGLTYQYAVIDGKQRLETILSFIRGHLPLSEDFKFFEDESVEIGGRTFPEINDSYPALARRFLDYQLTVVSVVSDSGDLIEEMFQRLNAASALNSAEKRNSVSGSTRDASNVLATHQLLLNRSPIKNARYKYRELAAKFLAIEHQIHTRGKLVDTKAATLSSLFYATHNSPQEISNGDMENFRDQASIVLDRMAEVFGENDPLLASIGTVVVYYIVFRSFHDLDGTERSKLERFEEQRREASRMFEDDSDYARAANARFREYNIFVQSTNDGRALERRAQILSTYLTGSDEIEGMMALDLLGERDIPAPENDSE